MKKKDVIWLGAIASVSVAIYYYLKWEQKNYDTLNQSEEKNKYLAYLMRQWVWAKQEEKNFSEYFRRCNYKTIAVYGMGIIGKILVKELENSDIKILYGIDRNAKGLLCDIELFTLDDRLPKVDAVVVTVGKDYDSIKKQLIAKGQESVISFEDVLFDVISMQ